MVKLVDVRSEVMGADKMTKSVGPAVLAKRLIGMNKSVRVFWCSWLETSHYEGAGTG